MHQDRDSSASAPSRTRRIASVYRVKTRETTDRFNALSTNKVVQRRYSHKGALLPLQYPPKYSQRNLGIPTKIFGVTKSTNSDFFLTVCQPPVASRPGSKDSEQAATPADRDKTPVQLRPPTARRVTCGGFQTSRPIGPRSREPKRRGGSARFLSELSEHIRSEEQRGMKSGTRLPERRQRRRGIVGASLTVKRLIQRRNLWHSQSP